jgi:hypothetical protein
VNIISIGIGLFGVGIGTSGRKPILFNSNITFVKFDSDDSYREKKDGNKQITNIVEAKAAVSLVIGIRKKDPNCKIAIITPYKGQKKLLSNSLLRSGVHYQIDNIFVDTVDSFQGSEADVVVFCTTRAIQPTQFFMDTRRLNVALSRAKRELIILGRMRYYYRFDRNESCLPALADYIQKHGNIVPSDKCDEVQAKRRGIKKRIQLLSLDDISLPTAFYMDNHDAGSVQRKIDEYYDHGDFLLPLRVKQTNKGYILKDDFDQFRAAQALSVIECMCEIV